MAAFAYSFCIALLHSIWQAALLAAAYFLFTAVHKKLSPQAHKNLLLLTISTQVLLFSITFINALFSSNNGDDFSLLLTQYLPQQNSAILLYQWIFMGYINIVLIKTIKTLYQWQIFKKQLATTYSKPPIDIRLFTNAKALHLGIKQKVKVWYSNTVSSPLTFGFLKPIILIPISLANHISIQQTEAIILHELAHIKANDYIVNWFITFTEIVFFFNPFILAFCKKIRLQRELYCDSLVLQFNYSPIVYAEALLAAAKFQQSNPLFSLAAVSTKKQLLHRIAHFTIHQNAKKNKNPFVVLSLLIIGLLVVSFSFTTTYFLNSYKQPSAKQILSVPFLQNTIEWTGNPSTSSLQLPKVFFTKTVVTINKKESPKINISTEPRQNEPTTQLYPIEMIPVVNKEVEEDSKQIIIEEIQSGSNKPAVMMIYKVININGEWIFEPQMAITKTINDSAKLTKDSSDFLRYEEQ